MGLALPSFSETIAHCAENLDTLVILSILGYVVLGLFWLLVAFIAIAWLVILGLILQTLVRSVVKCLKGMREGQLRLEGTDGAIVKSLDV